MSQILRARERVLNHSVFQLEESYDDVRDRQYYVGKKFHLSAVSKKTKDQLYRVNDTVEHLSVFDKNSNYSQSMVGGSKVWDEKSKKHSRYEREDSPIEQYRAISEDKKSIIQEKNLRKKLHNNQLSLIITKPPIIVSQSPFKPIECCPKYADKFLNRISKEAIPYVDDIFPPQRNIVFHRKVLYQEEGLKFERLSKIYKHSSIQIIKYSEPTNISPSKFTNFSLLSACIILSEQPSKIMEIFRCQQINRQGIYQLHLCRDGVWRYFTIDDHMPIKLVMKKTLLFTNTIQQNNVYEIWPALIQKAIAKIYGTYMDLVQSSLGIIPFMKILTGLPVSEYNLTRDFRSYLIIIDSALRNKQFVILENIPKQLHENASINNINPNMSYRIIDIKKNYIIIRNLDEQQLCSRINFEIILFSKLIIFRNQNNFTYISQKLRHRQLYYSKVQLMILQNSRIYLQIHQNNPAYYKQHFNSKIQYKLSPYKIIITSKEKDKKIDHITITESGKQLYLQQGIYELKIHLCQKMQQDFTLSYYGEHMAKIQRIKNMQLWNQNCQC